MPFLEHPYAFPGRRGVGQQSLRAVHLSHLVSICLVPAELQLRAKGLLVPETDIIERIREKDPTATAKSLVASIREHVAALNAQRLVIDPTAPLVSLKDVQILREYIRVLVISIKREIGTPTSSPQKYHPAPAPPADMAQRSSQPPACISRALQRPHNAPIIITGEQAKSIIQLREA